MQSKYGIPDIKKFTIQCYYAGFFAGVVLLCGVSIVNVLHLDILHIFPPCILYTKTGLYCPGCGGTRSVHALMEGDVWGSFRYHPFVLYTAVIYATFMIKNSLYRLTDGKIKIMIFRPVYLYIAAILVVAQWIIKNILLIFFHMPL